MMNIADANKTNDIEIKIIICRSFSSQDFVLSRMIILPINKTIANKVVNKILNKAKETSTCKCPLAVC